MHGMSFEKLPDQKYMLTGSRSLYLEVKVQLRQPPNQLDGNLWTSHLFKLATVIATLGLKWKLDTFAARLRWADVADRAEALYSHRATEASQSGASDVEAVCDDYHSESRQKNDEKARLTLLQP